MNKNQKDVYHITEKEDSKSIWTRIGVAFVNKDLSLNVILNTVPLDGRLHIRDQRENKKGEQDV